MQRDGKYGVAVRISNPEDLEPNQNRTKMDHFVTLPRNGKRKERR